jgi:hypothetical protein
MHWTENCIYDKWASNSKIEFVKSVRSKREWSHEECLALR